MQEQLLCAIMLQKRLKANIPQQEKNILSKATNPYFTEEENHSEHFGLGLYICKILCEHHGGYLKIENCSIGAKVTAFFKSLD